MTTYDKAATFMHSDARPLERALFRLFFENGSRDDVLKELARFQNPDGGFGHGLESDIRMRDSSVIATTIAFQHLRAIDAPADHPVVVKGCAYLRDTYNAKAMNWPIIPDCIDNAPHAPWWQYGGELSQSLANPRAEIIGYLYDYDFLDDKRHALTDSAVQHLLKSPDDMEMHDLLCYLRLYATKGLPVKDAMRDKLTRILKTIVATGPAQWRSYGLQPLAVVESPQSEFAALFTDAIPANLDFIIEQQSTEGYWSPNWSWSDVSAEAWAQAERDWRSGITLQNLRTLRAFGRV